MTGLVSFCTVPMCTNRVSLFANAAPLVAQTTVASEQFSSEIALGVLNESMTRRRKSSLVRTMDALALVQLAVASAISVSRFHVLATSGTTARSPADTHILAGPESSNL